MFAVRACWARAIKTARDVFAVVVGGFSVLDNHLHVLLRLDPDLAEAWSDEEAVSDIRVYRSRTLSQLQVATAPETSDYKSIKQRWDHVEAQGATARLEAAKDGSVAGSHAAAGLEDSLWLCPIEDRRGLDSTREGMMQGFSLGSYVQLVDYTGRLFRQGKASIIAVPGRHLRSAPLRSFRSRDTASLLACGKPAPWVYAQFVAGRL